MKELLEKKQRLNNRANQKFIDFYNQVNQLLVLVSRDVVEIQKEINEINEKLNEPEKKDTTSKSK
jgi:hypothetical protein